MNSFPLVERIHPVAARTRDYRVDRVTLGKRRPMESAALAGGESEGFYPKRATNESANAHEDGYRGPAGP